MKKYIALLIIAAALQAQTVSAPTATATLNISRETLFTRMEIATSLALRFRQAGEWQVANYFQGRADAYAEVLVQVKD